MAYSAEVLADSPTSYLRLNDVSGTVAADATGNGNAGTYVGGPTLGVSGLIATDPDTAMQTSGNQQLTLPYSYANNTFTLELWWKWTAAGNSGAIWRDNTSAGGTGFILSASSTGIYVRIAGTTRQVSSLSIEDGIRHHLVLTYNGTTATFYLDGTQTDQWTQTSATLPATPIHIGFNGTNSNQYQPGIYDEVALYNYVLSSARVGVHYTEAGMNPAEAQIETNYLETMVVGIPTAQVETNYLETMATGVPTAQVETNYLETMVVVQPAQISSVYAEAVLSAPSAVQVESLYSEIVTQTTPAVQIESVYAELVLLPVAAYKFKGWGVPL